ncbi:MAG: vWA domain-containing protein [Granulosicoccus sp.]
MPPAIFNIVALLLTLGSGLLLAGCGQKVDSTESARAAILETVDKKVKPSYRENQVRANISLTSTNLLSMLPSLDEYPIVTGRPESHQVESVEIFTSSEKAGSGRDGFYVELADAFNAEQIQLSNGKQAAVKIRKIASGLSTQFMLAGRYIPDAFSPSNNLWGEMLRADGIKLDVISEVTAPNTAGIIVKKNKAGMITTDGKLDVARLLTSVTNGSFAMGYTNPYQSSTGLNFLLTVLNEFSDGDEAEMLSPDVASAFEAFQAGVPFVAQTTIQMRDAAQGSGVLDAMVMEHQSWVNVKGMSEYTFIPFGVRHDSPLYATESADPVEREVLTLFADFIASQQSVADRFGFARTRDYKSAWSVEDGATIARAQQLWKQKKSGGRPVAAVFVADISGSMEGKRLKNMQQALVESADLINASNAIGLVSYSESVNVDLDVRDFDVQQKSLFIGAVERLSAGGRTATNDAVLVAAARLYGFLDSHPDHKPIIFVLSDGERNRGSSLEDVQLSLEWSGIPVHTIAYEVQSDELKFLSSLAEGAYIPSTAESASYRIGNLLNSEM